MTNIVHDTPRAATSAKPDTASGIPYTLPKYWTNDDEPYERGVTRIQMVQHLLIILGDAHRECGINEGTFDTVAYGLQLVLQDAHRDFCAAHLEQA